VIITPFHARKALRYGLGPEIGISRLSFRQPFINSIHLLHLADACIAAFLTKTLPPS
jgi:hypothetical protein